METMIRQDIDSARSLFPPRAFLDLHLGKAECKTFKETVAANRDALYDFSRAWVRSSIIKLLHPKDWKERLKNKREVRVKDEIATSLNLTLSKVEFVDKTASSLGSSIDSCTGLKGSEIRRYRAIYDATILNGQGTLTLDAEVMNVAGKGWLVVGYRHE